MPGQGRGYLAEAGGDPEHELRREQRGQRTGHHRDGGRDQGQQRDGQGDGQRAPWPKGRDEPAGRAGQRERPGCLRNEAQTGEYRAEPSPLLQVQRHQQHLPRDDGAHGDQDQVGSGDTPVFQQRQVQQRCPGRPLPRDEHADQQDRGRGQQHRLGGPQRVARSYDGEHEQGNAGGHRDGAGNVQLPPATGRVRGQQAHRSDQQREANRDVDEEDQAPGDLGQQAPEHRTRRESRRNDRAVKAQRAAALLLAGPVRDEQGQARWGQHRRPDSLHDAGRDEKSRFGGKPSGHARDHEHDQADPEQFRAAEHVGEPAAQQQEPPERDRVAAQQPLKRRRGDVQAVLDRRQRDVNDGEIQHHHELRHRQHQQQREPRTGHICRSAPRPRVVHVCRRLHRASPSVCVQAASNYFLGFLPPGTPDCL